MAEVKISDEELVATLEKLEATTQELLSIALLRNARTSPQEAVLCLLLAAKAVCSPNPDPNGMWDEVMDVVTSMVEKRVHLSPGGEA